MKLTFSLLLSALSLVALSSCSSPSTSGTPQGVGLRASPAGQTVNNGVEDYRANDGYNAPGAVGLTVLSAGVETGSALKGAAKSAGKAIGGTKDSGKKALDWWINEAPKR